MALSKRELFQKRRLRVRNKLRKVNRGKIRLSVHRSNKNISAQLIDDVAGVTLVSASTLEKDLGVVGKNNVEAAAKVGGGGGGRPNMAQAGGSNPENIPDAIAAADALGHVRQPALKGLGQLPRTRGGQHAQGEPG